MILDIKTRLSQDTLLQRKLFAKAISTLKHIPSMIRWHIDLPAVCDNTNYIQMCLIYLNISQDINLRTKKTELIFIS